MKKENCFGIVPLTQKAQEWRVFIVLHKKGSYWGFPKGHLNPKEKPKEGAKRELQEETGMKVISYLDFPPLFHAYSFEREGCLIEKKVQFFLALVGGKYATHSSEIIEGKWIPLKNLILYATFKDEKKLFQELMDLLT